MNYVKHLNQWFDIIAENQEVKPTHITLYFVLFQLWNLNRFSDTFIINRHEMINLTKLGSKSTYSRCMKDLHRWGWIQYNPSTSKYGVSTISMFKWEDHLSKNKQENTAIPSDQKEFKSASSPNATDPSSGSSTDASSGSSSVPSNGSSSGQEVGHILKHINNKPETENNKTVNGNSKKNNFKSKFHEPL